MFNLCHIQTRYDVFLVAGNFWLEKLPARATSPKTPKVTQNIVPGVENFRTQDCVRKYAKKNCLWQPCFQVRRASSARIGCTPGRVLLLSPGKCSRFPPKTPFGPENHGYAFWEFPKREFAFGGGLDADLHLPRTLGQTENR